MSWSKLKQQLESFLCPGYMEGSNTGQPVIGIYLINLEFVILL